MVYNEFNFLRRKRAVEPLGIELISLNDLKCEIRDVVENGNTPLENAQIKAKAYYDAFQIPVFSCDSGLYFDELEEREQPGIFIRRVNGQVLSDEEMIQYYSELAKTHGGKMIGRYRNFISVNTTSKKKRGFSARFFIKGNIK